MTELPHPQPVPATSKGKRPPMEIRLMGTDQEIAVAHAAIAGSPVLEIIRTSARYSGLDAAGPSRVYVSVKLRRPGPAPAEPRNRGDLPAEHGNSGPGGPLRHCDQADPPAGVASRRVGGTSTSRDARPFG